MVNFGVSKCWLDQPYQDPNKDNNGNSRWTSNISSILRRSSVNGRNYNLRFWFWECRGGQRASLCLKWNTWRGRNKKWQGGNPIFSNSNHSKCWAMQKKMELTNEGKMKEGWEKEERGKEKSGKEKKWKRWKRWRESITFCFLCSAFPSSSLWGEVQLMLNS